MRKQRKLKKEVKKVLSVIYTIALSLFFCKLELSGNYVGGYEAGLILIYILFLAIGIYLFD